MIKEESFEIGRLRGVTIFFEEAMDELPVHSHPEGLAHITMVRRGKVMIVRPNQPDEIIHPGTLKLFKPHELHGYVALEAKSKITNIIY